MDLDRELRAMFRERERDVESPIVPPQSLVPRVRRRQSVVVSEALAAVVAVVLVGAAIATIVRSTQDVPARPTPYVPAPPTPAPADRPAPALGSVLLGDVRWTVPPGWHLIVTDGRIQELSHARRGLGGLRLEFGSIVALTNFTPPLTSADPCEGMPPDGVVLALDVAAPTEAPTSWPAELAPTTDPEFSCGSDSYSAQWTWGGVGREATLDIGPKADEADKGAARTAFDHLEFVAGHGQEIPVGSCDPMRFDAGEVMGADAAGAWRFVLNPNCQSVGIATNRGVITTGGAGFFDERSPATIHADEIVLRAEGYLIGAVPADAARVVVRPDPGGSIAATLHPMGSAFDGVQVFVVPLAGIDTGTIDSFDASGVQLGTYRFVPAAVCSACGRIVQPGERIAGSGPREDTTWEVVETDGLVQLRGADGHVLAQVDASPAPLNVATASLPNGRYVVFGVVTSEASNVEVLTPVSNLWLLAPEVPLTQGRLAFAAYLSRGQVGVVVATDQGCHVVAAADPQTGNAVGVPSSWPRNSDCER